MPPPWKEDPYWARPNAREKRTRDEMKAAAFREAATDREEGLLATIIRVLRRIASTGRTLWRRL